KAFLDHLEDPERYHVLLYPAENPEFIDQQNIPNSWKPPLEENNKILTLHLIDATWPMAKKMMRVSKKLQEMPKVSFQKAYQSKFIIKHQPHECCLSTIETAFYCLEGLKDMGLENHLNREHDNLYEILDTLVRFQLKCEHDPNIKSSRGRKPFEKDPKKVTTSKNLEYSRIREKKNRLFYWDVDRSPVGRK
ncbi:MAG: DTW domain-containing protein, partial [Halobacteriovoraceae bacterium]|nr:DTW domain-containing protein [Halobacteriovoraceae bacterium]